MRRRNFIGLIAAAAACPRAARTQQSTMPVVGFLNGQTAAGFAYLAAAFRQGLSEVGFNEGQNVRIEYRWADGNINRVRPLADELIRQGVALIAAAGGGHLIVREIKTIPIVFSFGGDPVRAGLVANINRPAGNATGVLTFATDLETKRLELLHELIPRNAIVGVLLGPRIEPTNVQSEAIAAGAKARGRQILLFNVAADGEMDKLFATIDERKVAALVVTGHPFFVNNLTQVLKRVASLRIPAIFENREFAAAGGLMSYGINIADVYRQIGVYAGRILKGEKAADLPVMQPTKFDVSVNLRTAKALGIEIPVSILLRADEVIESRRREFMLGISASATAAPTAWGQLLVRRVGLITASNPQDLEQQRLLAALRTRLLELGWREGHNISLVIRSTDGASDNLSALIAELTSADVETILVSSTGLAAAVQKATRVLPIITISAGDLVGTGLAQSLRMPGGNVTGIQILSPELMSKRAELVKELLPNARRVALVMPITPTGIITSNYIDAIVAAAKAFTMEVHRVELRGVADVEPAFAAMAAQRDDAAIVVANPLSVRSRHEIAAAAIQARIPTIYEARINVAAGGLLSYGANFLDVWRRSASFVDKILKGTLPAELPVEQPTKFELVINNTTAKQLALVIPPTLLARADEVID